jgi:hypothetical protein
VMPPVCCRRVHVIALRFRPYRFVLIITPAYTRCT